MEPSQISTVIPESTFRTLSDKSSDKRKGASQEIGNAVSTLSEKGEFAKIESIIMKLSSELVQSSDPNFRIGAQQTLGRIGVALDQNISRFIPNLIQPIVFCTNDSESLVRYYANEALFNTCSGHPESLAFVVDIFNSLCVFISDPNNDVKTAAQLLSNEVLKLVYVNSFDTRELIEGISERLLEEKNKYVSRLCLSWVLAIQLSNWTDLMEYTHVLMNCVFLQLRNENKEIRELARNILREFFQKLSTSTEVISDYALNSILHDLVQLITNEQVSIVLTAIAWINELCFSFKTRIHSHADLLRTMILCLRDNNQEVKASASAACDTITKSFLNNEVDQSQTTPSIIEVICEGLESDDNVCIIIMLHFCMHILEDSRLSELMIINEHLQMKMIKSLMCDDQDAIDLTLRVLMDFVSRGVDSNQLLNSIIRLLNDHKSNLEDKGCVIIRKLCRHMDPLTLFPAFSAALLKLEDLSFVSLLIQVVNTLILTESETESIRVMLRGCFNSTNGNKNGQQLFDTLFPAWCINPFAALALCWYTECYELAHSIVQCLSVEEPTLFFLLQADKLVHLLESPLFIHLRLRMLDMNNPATRPLLQSLYGLLMILPQGNAYTMLQSRLNTVTPVHVILDQSNLNYVLTEADIRRAKLFEQNYQTTASKRKA